MRRASGAGGSARTDRRRRRHSRGGARLEGQVDRRAEEGAQPARAVEGVVGQGEPNRETGEQDEGRERVPGVEVAEAEVGQEAGETGDVGEEEGPPCPDLAGAQRE